MDFGSTLKTLRKMSGKSRYRLAQLSGIDQAYLLRLERGEQTNPSRDLVIRLGLALVSGSQAVTLENVDELLFSAGFAPLQRRHRLGLTEGVQR